MGEAWDGGMFLSVLSAVGAIASIVTLIVSFRGPAATLTFRALLALVVALTVSTAALSYRSYLSFSEAARAQRLREDELQRRAQASVDATALLESMHVQRFDPGGNEGAIWSGIAYLERYRDLFPETYKLMQADILEDFAAADGDRESSGSSEVLFQTAKSMEQILRGLARHTVR